MANTLGATIGAAGGISKFFEGRKMQKQAQAYIDQFEWDELNNAYENLQVSTLGADLQAEEAARMAATSANALQQGGNRAIVGGLGRVEAQSNQLNRQIAADLDQQQKQIDYAAAQDDANIRAMQERRQGEELQGYGQMLSTGMGTKYGGISDVMNAAMFAGVGKNTPAGTPASTQTAFSNGGGNINLGGLLDIGKGLFTKTK